ncbi:MAG TPA: hypothetical protein VE972_07305 [Conexibacter sp.]|nr:hypothetical protein [Conexibacter sp.]
MHETTVRFTGELWARVRERSEREGISAAQFIRDATVARIAVEEHVRPLRIELDTTLRALDQRMRRVEHTLGRHGIR